eukprot:15347775-Alexandrium_andersonii.AAC.1
MNTPLQLDDASRDLARGLFGPRWRHTEPDDDWRAIVSSHWETPLAPARAFRPASTVKQLACNSAAS